MPTRPEDALTADGSGTVEPMEGAHSPSIEAAPAAKAAPAAEDARSLKRAKRAEAKAKKRADAAAKKASLAYAEAAAALRSLEEASRKVSSAPAAQAAAPVQAAPAPAAAEAAAEPPAGAPAVTAEPAVAAAQAAPAPADAAGAAVAPEPEPVPAAAAPAQAVAVTPAPAEAAPATAASTPAAVPAAEVPAAVPAVAAPTVAAPAEAAPVAPVAPAPVAGAAPAFAAAMPPAPMPAMGPMGQPGMPPYVIVQPRRGRGGAIALALVGVVLAAALVAAGVLAYQNLFAPKAEVSEPVPTAVGPVANSTGIPLAKVSLRANAEGWAEETSTPVVAHIQRIDGGASGSSSASSASSAASGASSGSSASTAATQAASFAAPVTADAAYRPGDSAAAAHQAASSSSSASSASSSADASASSSSSASDGDSVSATANADYDAYHAFTANESSTLSLIPGRYMFTYITPLNSDRSLYEVPEPVEVTVGDDGTALLPVELTRIAPEDVTDEQAEQAMAALRVAMAHGDGSFSNAAFKTAYDKAFSEWFAPKEEEAQLTDEERQRLEEEARASGLSSSAAASAHTHTWVAQTEDRVVTYTATIVESPAWDEPIYDSRGNVIGYSYHPAVTRTEERQRTERVIVGYRCSECGATGSA